MDQSNSPIVAHAAPHNGWTEARKAQFLDHLAGHGNVRAACSCVGMSREAAYRLRRRDALFARGWAAALVLAREASAEVLACRAIDGVEEEVWHRGELVGTRRRYDTRLLLAHMARLDALAESGGASEDAARFDELLALVAGAAPPEEVVCDESGVPLSREASVALAKEVAAELPREDEDEDGEPTEATPVEPLTAALEAAAHWDAWVETARATIDRLLGEPLGASAAPARTLSEVSSSPLANPLACVQPAADAGGEC